MRFVGWLDDRAAQLCGCGGAAAVVRLQDGGIDRAAQLCGCATSWRGCCVCIFVCFQGIVCFGLRYRDIEGAIQSIYCFDWHIVSVMI